MHLANKPVNELKVADIQRLIDVGVREDKFIDYKETLHLSTKDEKKEFLYDITSFANTLGGEIIYGVVEERDAKGKPNGLPKEIKGIDVQNLDALELLIEGLFRDCVDERLTGIQHIFVEIKEHTYILIFRISMSLKAPHMAKGRFYARGGSSGSKYLMDVREIKMAFDRTSGLKERAEKFIEDRLKQVELEVNAKGILEGGYIIGHVIPLLRDEYQLDITKQDVVDRLRKISPPYSGVGGTKYTYEGFKTYSDYQNDEGNYNLFFRDGSIEFYAEGVLVSFANPGELTLASVCYEKKLIEYFDQLRTLYEDNTINLPFIYCMSLVNIQGARMVYGPSPTRYSDAIKKNLLSLPKLYVDDLSEGSATILKPLFDMIWNAFGLPRSFNYTEDGVFSPSN